MAEKELEFTAVVPAAQPTDKVSLKHERVCLLCPGPPEYTNSPCKCHIYCRKCAMKLATGGKCKTCKQLFSSMTRLR
ncbi:hypothetical protein B484DRAFT_398408 [Ochromonadaceae sp. CCMP2298]|nr:hypothetical protein B484DRAFT_398408 [Ochromonadaceae sp. CCMP2298]